MSRIIARPATIPEPADMPCSARNSSSCGRLCAAAQPIDSGMATEAVLAHVAIMKYGYQVPLYRQEWLLAASAFGRPPSAGLGYALPADALAGLLRGGATRNRHLGRA